MRTGIVFGAALVAAAMWAVPASAGAAAGIAGQALAAKQALEPVVVDVRAGRRSASRSRVVSRPARRVVTRHRAVVARGFRGRRVVARGVAGRRFVVVRPWVRRPYYGRWVYGVALGTIVVATAVAVAPLAPHSSLCWYWSNPARTHGYWDYCY